MPCKWELILQMLLPLAGAGFDVYAVAPGNTAYTRIGDPSEACQAATIVLTPHGLKPFETEKPIDDLMGRIDSVPDIEKLKRVNRKGPFYGYYLEIRQTGGGDRQ